MKYVIAILLTIIIIIGYLFQDATEGLNENYDNKISQLKNHGYIIYRDVILDKNVVQFRDSFTDKLDYTEGKKYIDQNLLPIMKATFGDTVYYKKYRISNNNNSTDAGSFHRDINHFTHYKSTCPLYTVINSLDGSTMELIPNSHKIPKMSLKDSFKFLSERKTVKLNPTDILIFNASLLHRSNFNIKQPHRRLIQLFETYPNKQIFNKYNPKIQTIRVTPSTKFNPLPKMVTIPVLKEMIGGYEYFRMSTQKFLPINVSKKDLWKNNNDFYVTYEHTAPLNPKDNTKNKTNMYTINVDE